MSSSKANPYEGPANIAFNIVIPVLVLNKLSKYLGPNGPLYSLLLALAFPLLYGAYDYFKAKKKNALSLLGLANILATGGLALMKLEGHWFAVKEGVFPALIGLAVLVSAFTARPLISWLVFNESLMDVALIEERLRENNTNDSFKGSLKKLTIALSISFFLSAVLNYVIGLMVFTNIPETLSELERSEVLNAQIAKMTWLGFVVIALPSMAFMMGVLWSLLRSIDRYTGLKFKDVVRPA